ncbi:glucokinase [Mitsuaria sp. GD03876]|uniref:glucokinase n=1 Tax=Mitsuaria sp. GD03876 TaxID=2975399 RepID=UPI00244D3826|nr:glucokinase [Mitsuaria sp. GD03876]MDH0867311.1 glucokinase [Mitsuaria sp. GD03876]
MQVEQGVAVGRNETTGRATSAAGYPWLVADIGGSNARFAWVDGPGQPVQHVRKLPVAQYESLRAAAEAYLKELAGLGLSARPRRASLALATAINEDRIELTNSHWTFSRSQLQAALGLDELRLLNDFEALALSLPRLRPDQVAAVPGPAQSATPRGTLAVIGPGTGLGVGGVIETSGGWIALPGEGGHMTLAPTNDYESELLAAARHEFPHVSAERFLSGIGLPTLHAAVAAVAGQPSTQRLSAEQILERAQAGDAICAKTVEQFCAFLGSFAGSVALALGARGGVYIGGGIVPRLGEGFFSSPFRARFEAKGRFAPYLASVPCVLITDTLTALDGAAFALEQSVR